MIKGSSQHEDITFVNMHPTQEHSKYKAIVSRSKKKNE